MMILSQDTFYFYACLYTHEGWGGELLYALSMNPLHEKPCRVF